jgi:squalene cyclase
MISALRYLLFTASFIVAANVFADEGIDRAIARGVEFLVADQNENGSWGSARQTQRG